MTDCLEDDDDDGGVGLADDRRTPSPSSAVATPTTVATTTTAAFAASSPSSGDARISGPVVDVERRRAGPPSKSPASSSSKGGGQSKPGRWDELFRGSRQYTMLKKVVRLLQDNRAVNSDDPETARQLNELNRSQTDSYPILKSILNGLFVSIGVVLLLGVLVVIAYTSFVKPGSGDIFGLILSSHSEPSAVSASPSSPTEYHQQQQPPTHSRQSPIESTVPHVGDPPHHFAPDSGAVSATGGSRAHATTHPPYRLPHVDVDRRPFASSVHSPNSAFQTGGWRSDVRRSPMTGSTPTPTTTPGGRPAAVSGMVVRCQFVPMVYRDREVQLRQICFQVPAESIDDEVDRSSEHGAR